MMATILRTAPWEARGQARRPVSLGAGLVSAAFQARLTVAWTWWMQRGR